MDTHSPVASGPAGPGLNDLLTALESKLVPPSADDPADDVAQRLNHMEVAVRRVAEVKRAFMDAFARWLETNGDLRIGPIRWYAGMEHRWRCLDEVRTLELLLDAVEGDLEAFCDHLAAGALKPGSCRRVLGEWVFNRMFVRDRRTEAKAGRPNGRSAIRLDERFAP